MLFYTRVDYTEDENESLLKEMALLSIGKIHKYYFFGDFVSMGSLGT